MKVKFDAYNSYGKTLLTITFCKDIYITPEKEKGNAVKLAALNHLCAAIFCGPFYFNYYK